MWGSTQSTFTIINNFLLHLRSTVYSTNATAVFYYKLRERRSAKARYAAWGMLQVFCAAAEMCETPTTECNTLSLNASAQGEKLGRNKRSIQPLFAALNFLFYFK